MHFQPSSIILRAGDLRNSRINQDQNVKIVVDWVTTKVHASSESVKTVEVKVMITPTVPHLLFVKVHHRNLVEISQDDYMTV